jgi:hypothetical protein
MREVSVLRTGRRTDANGVCRRPGGRRARQAGLAFFDAILLVTAAPVHLTAADSLPRAVEWLDWTEEAATCFGRVKAALERAGTPLDDMDLAIGSIALATDARLATRNARHLARIDGLRVEDWAGEAGV